MRGFPFLKGYSLWLRHASGLLGYTDEENKVSEDTAAVVQGRVLGARTKMVREMREGKWIIMIIEIG